MKFSIRDAERIGRLVQTVALSEILPRFRHLGPQEVREKTSSFDLVTAADEAAEIAIHRGLRRLFPDATVIGEEAVSREPALLRRIAEADVAILIDPIDGTKNFASGVPLFGVMVAVVQSGEVVLGVIHEPITGETSFALRGEGAWVVGASGRHTDLKVASSVRLEDMQGVAGTNFLPEPLKLRVLGGLGRLGLNFWLRSAAVEYRLLASGNCHFIVYNKLMPWDHAAGWLLHAEAGGYAAQFDGGPYLPTKFDGGLICATDADAWHDLREALLGPF